jgi:hypothetical protein
VSALDQPSEILLIASFAEPGPAEAAARAFLHSGLGVDHVAILTRASRGATLAALPHASSLRMRGLGRALVRGALAVELGRARAGLAGEARLGAALRRLGLSLTELPSLARAVRAGRILVLAAVPREEALGWGRLLQGAGAVSLSAHPRLRRWPPAGMAAVERRLPTPPPVTPRPHRGRLRRDPEPSPWWDGTGEARE